MLLAHPLARILNIHRGIPGLKLPLVSSDPSSSLIPGFFTLLPAGLSTCSSAESCVDQVNSGTGRFPGFAL